MSFVVLDVCEDLKITVERPNAIVKSAWVILLKAEGRDSGGTSSIFCWMARKASRDSGESDSIVSFMVRVLVVFRASAFVMTGCVVGENIFFG
jgi:hypothetical protein